MIIREDVIRRILDRQTRWENGGTWRHVAGNFDGQGMSLGSIQFAAGQGTLQPVLKAMIERFSYVVKRIVDNYNDYNELIYALFYDDFFKWTLAINEGDYIPEPWHGRFEAIANSPEWLEVEKPFIQPYIKQAEYIIRWFASNSTGDSILTDRGLDLAFDIACQLWQPEYYALAETNYTDKLLAISKAAELRASDQWKADTYSRKAAIAKRDGGMVHGSLYIGTYDDLPMYEEERDAFMESYNDIKGHWAEEVFRKFIERGIIRGDENRNVNPDRPATLAQVVSVVDRALEDFYNRYIKEDL